MLLQNREPLAASCLTSGDWADGPRRWNVATASWWAWTIEPMYSRSNSAPESELNRLTSCCCAASRFAGALRPFRVATEPHWLFKVVWSLTIFWANCLTAELEARFSATLPRRISTWLSVRTSRMNAVSATI